MGNKIPKQNPFQKKRIADLLMALSGIMLLCGCSKGFDDVGQGKWLRIKDTTNISCYYLINDSLFVTTLSDDASISDYEFVSNCRELLIRIEDIDLNTFEVNDFNDGYLPYARDKNKVYYPYCGTIDCYSALDFGGEVFSGDISVRGADPNSFRYIGEGYAVD
ncbi:DKNYY domain-containing protein, partial [uncultured Duncaniella sp.]|uniref:DKNYY domain-containing protein n=1 Tax=uncultured Duncaniella sp. TaxID=2768039 RepID=UPI00265A166B